jgi:hypothetical protein
MNRQRHRLLAASALMAAMGCSGHIDLGNPGDDGGFGPRAASPEAGGLALDAAGSYADAQGSPLDAWAYDDGLGSSLDAAFFDDGVGSRPDAAFFDDGVGGPQPAEPEGGGLLDGDFSADALAYWEGGVLLEDGAFGGPVCNLFPPSCTCLLHSRNGHAYGVVCEPNATCSCYIDNTLTSSLNTSIACIYDTGELYTLCGFPFE